MLKAKIMTNKRGNIEKTAIEVTFKCCVVIVPEKI